MSLTVVSGTRKFKIPVTPGTLLSQVRDQACSSEGGLSVSTNDYGLSHQGKRIDLTIPFRYSNLVNNAQLDLVKLRKAEFCRVKVRIPGSQDFIGQFPSSSTVQDVLNEAKLNGQLTLNNVPTLPKTELASLGGEGGILFVYKKGSGESRKLVTPIAAKPPNTEPISVSSNYQSLRAAVVSLATSHYPNAEEPPEMSTKQFMTYYQHIKQQAEPPMVSKSTQAKLNLKKPVEFTTIKIKFPDQSTLEGRFANGELGSDVYKFVEMYLRDPKPKFELVSMKPHFVLEPQAHLINDCEFGSRAMLVFRSDKQSETSFLNDHALASVRSALPAEESKPALKGDPPEKNKKLKHKLTPKWLKLHKS